MSNGNNESLVENLKIPGIQPNNDIRITVATCPETLGTFSNYCSKLDIQWAQRVYW